MKQLLKESFLVGCGCIATCIGAAAAFADAAPVAPDHQAATWQERNYSFAFLGFTSTYSCDGLADKLKVLLLAAGARKDVKARAGACANGFGRPDKFARADLTFYTLVPLGAADSTKTEPSGAAAAVTGIWHPVIFASHQPRELATGDCELVEQFKSDVLPLLSTRNVSERSTCIPHQDSGSVINLQFESLGIAGPPAKQSPGRP